MPSLQGGNIFRAICSNSLISAECKTSLMKSCFWRSVVSNPGRHTNPGNMASRHASSLIGRCGQHSFTRRGNSSSPSCQLPFPSWKQALFRFHLGSAPHGVEGEARNLNSCSDSICRRLPRALSNRAGKVWSLHLALGSVGILLPDPDPEIK